MTVIKTRVAPEFKARFNNAAKAMGLTESEFLRRAAEVAMAGPAAGAIPAAALDPDDAATAQVTIRMANFLLKAVKARAKANEMAPSRWITALVQSNVTQYPVVKVSDSLALEANERQLAALGRNLNQTARSMNFANSINPGSFTKEWMPMNRLDEVIGSIDAGMSIISVVVRTSKEVWSVD